MQKTVVRSLLFILFLLIPFTAVQAQQEKVVLEFYYGEGCPHCAKVIPFIDELESRYPALVVQKMETYHDVSNAQHLMNVFSRFNIPHTERGVPTVVIGDQIFIGDGEMLGKLEQAVIARLGGEGVNNNLSNVGGEINAKPSFWSYLFAILGPAFVDSINPCAIAVLVILLGALMMYQDKRRALLGGLAFVISIYVTYFLFGLGLTHIIKMSGMSLWIYKTIGIIALLIGLANIKDAFWYGKGGFVMEIPRSWRPTLKRMLNAVTSPLGAFLVGFVVTLFELPCMGGPYFFVIGLLAQKVPYQMIIPLLLLYNIVFVIPLLIVTGVIPADGNLERQKYKTASSHRWYHYALFRYFGFV